MKTLTIKYGGNAIADTNALNDFATAIAELAQTHRITIIHGGGPQINHWLEKMKIESHFINGQRYTDAPTLEIVEMVLCAHVNKAIVRALRAVGLNAVGISGQDSTLLTVSQNNTLGLVGHITATNPTLINTLLDNQYIPIIAPLGCDTNAQTFNINADYVAAHIAGAIKADECLFMTNVNGLLDKEKNKISHANRAQIDNLIADGTINGGMIPKVECALTALQQGVTQTRIINGITMDALLALSKGENNIGTTITL